MSGAPRDYFEVELLYDHQRRMPLLVGSAGNPLATGSPVTPVLVWGWSGAAWSLLDANGPSFRGQPAVTYDVARGEVVMFGGLDASYRILGETWTWGTQWRRRSPTTSPPATAGARMTYDWQRQLCVMAGGTSSSQDFQTWEWNGNDWGFVPTPTRLGWRFFHALTYDLNRQKTLMFGGSPAPYDATWEYDGSDWRQMNPSLVPSGRVLHGLSYSWNRNSVLLFGGQEMRLGYQYLNDLWEWDGSDWHALNPILSPTARFMAHLTYDHRVGRMLLFGGSRGYKNALTDTWELVPRCEYAGPGHAAGGLSLSCATEPFVGAPFCLAFPSTSGTAALLVAPGACSALPLRLPLLCSDGFLYPRLPAIAALSVLGNPASICLPIPNDTRLLGATVCLQGWAQQPQPCLLLTSGVSATISR